MDATKPRRLFLLAVCLLSVYTGMAQDRSLQKTLQLPTGKLRLDSISQLISRQTSFRFSINSSKVNASTLIDISSRNVNLELLLNKLKNKFGVPYSVVGNHIIFSDHIAGQPGKPRITTVVKRKPPPVNREPVVIKPARVAATTPQQLTVNTQLAIAHRRIRTTLRPKAAVNQFVNNNVAARLPALYAHIAVFADDVLYANASAAFGKSWLYATARWGTNNSLKGFRYGIGSGIDLSGDWLLRIELTTGAFKKESDSSRWKTTVKSKLHRAAFLMERKINDHLSVHGGLLVNLLQTKYFLNDVATAPDKLVPKMGKDDSRLYNVKPWYTLFDNSAADKSTSRQLWVGLQVGVIYRLNF